MNVKGKTKKNGYELRKNSSLEKAIVTLTDDSKAIEFFEAYVIGGGIKMAIRKYKPTSAGLRSMSVLGFEEITKTTPEKSLTSSLSKSGRNSYGRTTSRHRRCGAKRKYRIIDFKRNKDGTRKSSSNRI